MRVIIPVAVIHFGKSSSWCWLSLVKDVEVSALSLETLYVDQKGKEITRSTMRSLEYLSVGRLADN